MRDKGKEPFFLSSVQETGREDSRRGGKKEQTGSQPKSPAAEVGTEIDDGQT